MSEEIQLDDVHYAEISDKGTVTIFRRTIPTDFLLVQLSLDAVQKLFQELQKDEKLDE